MFARIVAALLVLVFSAGTAFAKEKEQFTQSAWAKACDDWDDWDKPGPPFRIYGNTWYVGTCGIAAILIVGEPKHILIDGGTEAGAHVVAANIARLGYDIKDVGIILFSHEHHDHVGGLAKLQQLSGAALLSSRAGRLAMTTGKTVPEDPQHGISGSFPPVKVSGIVDDNSTVDLGNLSILALETPGHTPGALSWQWSAVESGKWMTINYIDSLTAISADDYRFTDHPQYVAKFRTGLHRLSAIGCGILVTPHPSASDMRKRILQGGLVEDRPSCAALAASRLKSLDERLAKEQAAK